MTAPIQILLSTYNGAEYLAELLASLDDQRGVPEWNLLWRDDGSSDNSQILLRNRDRTTELLEGEAHLGPARSFLCLLAEAPEDAKAFAFCDQDDVWLPDKLARAWSWVSVQPSDKPALYFSRQKLVDATLRPIGLSPEFHRPSSFENALVQNIAAGCTIMMNGAARRLILSAPLPPDGSMHDWWSYILVSGAGGIIYADQEATVLYRQHNKNTIGSTRSVFHRACRLLKRGRRPFLLVFNAHLETLKLAQQLLDEKSNKKIVDLSKIWRLRPLKRAALFLKTGIYRQRIIEHLVLISFILLGLSES